MMHTHLMNKRGNVLHFWYYDAVDATQLDINLKAQVRDGLNRYLVDIFGLHTLGGYSQKGIPYSFDFR